MDERSHEMFADILLEKVRISETSLKWGTAPDIDMPFLHRWYRHRISVLPKIYKEFTLQERLPWCWTSDNMNAISLCVVSHLYLDIFNGWVFPFGIRNPIYPRKTVINGVLEDMDKPKLLVKELRRLAGEGSYPEQFYCSSKEIMETIFLNNASVEELTSQLVRRLSIYASGQTSGDPLYSKAMQQIAEFTGNDRYLVTPVDFGLMDEACSRFETEYARLINRGLEA